MMTCVTISPKFQIVIPEKTRKRLRLVPGQKLAVFDTGSSIRYVPITPIAEAYGMFAGLENNFEREKVDRDPRG